jgi:hypothetical protein
VKNSLKFGLVAALALLFANQTHAGPMNLGPPSGAILDLDGQALPNAGYVQYSVDFTATAAMTNISFAIRNDPGFFGLDDVTLLNKTTSTAVPVVNGGFESGIVGNNAPVGWTYLNTFGAAFSGIVQNNAAGVGISAHTGTNFYYDGATQAYDGITQGFTTVIGDTYTISFFLVNQNKQLPLTNFSRLSTNGDVTDTGGNAADVLVYAGAIPTAPTPEPATITLLGIGIAGMAGYRLRRRKAAAAS